MKKNKIGGIYFLILIFTVLLSLSSIAYANDPAVSGKGTKSDPYILNFEYAKTLSSGKKCIEISYKKKADFWFVIHEANAYNKAGTYIVEYEKSAKKVRIIFVSEHNNTIYYKRESAESEYYVQAGALAISNPNTVEPEQKDCKFNIFASEDSAFRMDIGYIFNPDYFWSYITNLIGEDSTPYEYQLKNTFEVGSANPQYVQHPSYFVFAPSYGTVEELYGPASEKVIEGTAYSSNIRYNLGYAEYIIEPQVPVWAGFAYSHFPTRVVRFGTYDISNLNPNESDIENQDKHKLILKYHFVANDIEADEKAGVIETAITKILLGIGDVFIAISKAFLGDSVTMDSIIFNRYEGIIVDFRGEKGFLSNSEVRRIINYMYSGFEKIAIVANIIILLYLGIQIVVNIGGEKQSKYSKNLQNWLVGILILFFAPRFFPILTDVTNAMVGYIGTAVSPQLTQYNIASMLDDDALLGEDAETVDIDEQIKAGINSKTAQKKRIEKEIKALQDNGNIKYQVIKNYDSLMDDITDIVSQIIAGTMSMVGQPFDQAAYKNEMDFDRYVTEIKEYIESNRRTWTTNNEAELQAKIDNFNDKWSEHATHQMCPEHGIICLYGCERIYPIQVANEFFVEYKKLQLKCGELENQIMSLQSYQGSKDLMGEMRVKAGKTGRVTYVIIWYILFFQLISILALYYKRLIMVAILIMLFPIVMITYAIDKIGDGTAQTLETWTKEFTINIVVQIVHAVVYVTLIKTGMSIFESNPNNWLIFIIAVLCLFPVERLLRSIFGLNGSTMNSLKSNVLGGAIAAAVAIRAGVKGAKGAKNFAKDAKKQGFKGAVNSRVESSKNKMKDKWNKFNKEEDKKIAKKDAKDKKRKAVADRKKQTRDTNIQRRRQQMQNASGVKKAWLKTVNAASMVRNGMYHVGNAGRKIKGIAKDPRLRMAGRAMKVAGISARKLGGLTAGVITGSTNAVMAAGKGAGLTGSVAQATKVAKDANSLVGGAKKKDKKDDKAKQQIQTTALPSTSDPKNMPGGRPGKKVAKPARERVANRSTRDGARGKAKIKNAKKVTKTARKTYRQSRTRTTNTNNNSNNGGNNAK